MLRRMFWLSWVGTLVLLTGDSVFAADTTRELVFKAQRILFLGDSITASGKYVAIFDAWLWSQRRDMPPVIVNAGLSSETVSGLSEEGHAGGKFPRPDLFERIDRVLAIVEPDLVFTCYGINCGIYQPFDESRFSKYQSRYRQLREKIVAVGAQHVAITPPFYDDRRRPLTGFSYNAVLDRYAAWLVAQAQQQGWRVVDLHTAMTQEIQSRRASDPEFLFQPDGVHPHEAGHWFIARQLIRECGDEQVGQAASADAMLSAKRLPAEMLSLFQRRTSVLQAAYVSAAGHLRPGVAAGLPLAEAQQKYQEWTEQIESQGRQK